MYELISIEEDEMTRIVKLINLDTGTVEECFDDSTIVSDEGFNFMKVGQKYDCKINLFGKVVENTSEKSVLCKIVDRNMVIGTKHMIKIKVKNDQYYIPQKKLVDYFDKDIFIFDFSRKDLIQVNDVIHADML